MGPQGPQGLIKCPRGPGDLKNWGAKFFENSIFQNWGAEFFENSILHEFLIQGGLGGAEHPAARYKVKGIRKL